MKSSDGREDLSPGRTKLKRSPPPKKKKENEKSGKDWRLVCGMGKLTSFCMYHVVYTSLLHLDTVAGWEWGGEAAFFFFWWGKRVLFSSQERVFPDGWSIYESVWGFIPLLLRSFEWTMFFTSTKGTWGSPLEWGILPIAGDPSHRIFDPLPPANPQEETGQGSLYSSRRSYSPVWAGT